MAKKQRLWDFLTMVTSIIYGMSIFMFGIVLYFADLFVVGANKEHLSEWFNIYLSVVGIAFIIWLLIDIQSYLGEIGKRKDSGAFNMGKIKLVIGDDGYLQIETEAKEKLPDYYCFSTGRHSGSFFLKIGCSIFCLGHIIHMILQIFRQVSYYFADDSTVKEECAAANVLAFDILSPIFAFLQVYMIFKFGNVIVNRRKPLSRYTLIIILRVYFSHSLLGTHELF